MQLNQSFKINEDNDKIFSYKNTKNAVFFDTSDENIKIVVFWKDQTNIFAVIKEDDIKEIDYGKYTLKSMLDNIIVFNNINYKPISVLSKSDFDDGIYKSSEHLAMETIDEFKWRWINSEIFKIKESIDWVIGKSVEKIVSNIFILLKQGYKVVWKIDKKTWKEIPFNSQKYIEKIISIKIKKGNFEWRLDHSYIFEK